MSVKTGEDQYQLILNQNGEGSNKTLGLTNTQWIWVGLTTAVVVGLVIIVKTTCGIPETRNPETGKCEFNIPSSN